jgi:hypothetical protein
MNLKFKNYLILIFLLFLVSYFLFLQKIKSQSVSVSAIIPGVCGNGIKEIGEACDGNDFGGLTCFNFGFSGGSLSCNSDCTINTSACTSPPPPSVGGGGGGYVPPQTGNLIISGRAYPNSEVFLLKDGQLTLKVGVGSDGKFTFTLSNISPGNYLYTLYAEDQKGNKSTLYNFPVFINSGQTIEVSNIILSPTIDVDKLEVKRGEPLTIFGAATPKAEVLISVSSEKEMFFKVPANDDGSYLYQLDTDLLEVGDHYTKSKTILAQQYISNYSRVVSFKVGQTNVLKKPGKCPLVGDFNTDCLVNLIDFSIMAYWYKRPLTTEGKKMDLNNDGKVDLIDFSILAYWWTG